ncbi:MAG: molybdenum cofactor guanylyltransferase [Syntrophobacterales bacterium]|jgi:molybdopterin-guanine dinucleotide biosynthesis protein A
MTILAGLDSIKRPPDVTGAILAGGDSRRWGRDKVTLRLDGKPLARWVAETLRPAVADLWLVTNHPQAHLALGLPLVTDLVPHQGPVGGLATALFYARTPWVLLASADTPLLVPELAIALAGAAGQTSRPALVCRSKRGWEPFPGLYATRLLPRVQDFLQKNRSFMAFLERVHPQVWGSEIWKTYDPEGASFFNLNQPEDLARLEAWAARRQET